MHKINCLVCGEKIEHENSSWIKRNLENHIKTVHNISIKDYYIKFKYDGKHPKCNCGCGNEVKFSKHKFNKFYKDHKNKVVGVYKHQTKKKLTKDKIIKRLSLLNIKESEFRNLFNLYKDYKISFSDLIKDIPLDKRTIKKYWILLKYVNNDDLKRISKKHQHIWSDKNNKKGGRKIIKHSILLEIYLLLNNNKGKYTLKEIINKFNLSYTELVLYKRLCENFSEKKVKDLLKLGISSKPETEFYNILCYYFGKSNLKKQFTLERKKYDIKLGENILIEFDGDYWHSLKGAKKSDKIKDNIALKNGFNLIRVKESESKNIEVLLKIKEIYENQISRNK
jgi:very-short-patch-repair endonuclease